MRVRSLREISLKMQRVSMKPAKNIERNQRWFWSKRWQDEERIVQQDFEIGRVKISESIEDLFRDLDE